MMILKLAPFLAIVLAIKLDASLVPLPQVYTSTDKQFPLNVDEFTFRFLKGSFVCDVTKLAFTRYHKIIFTPETYRVVQNSARTVRKLGKQPLKLNQTATSSETPIDHLSVHILNPCEKYPTLESDESYNLQVDENGAVLQAKTVWGSLRGLETFSQLVIENEKGERLLNKTYILDFPRFNHRGLLLDTSRHYLDMNLLKVNLEAMEANKLNVFHWHIVDDTSFPYQSSKFPDLSDLGAFDPYTHIYTNDDIAEVIEFARQRGIRVIPEFDTPGHTLSWGKALPILTPCYTGSEPNGQFGPIDPTRSATYELLRDLIKEVVSVFPDKYIHLGGDEVSFDCWASNPDINGFMELMQFNASYNKLEQFYIQKLLDIVKETSPSTGYMIWQEVIDNDVKVRQDTIVQVWKPQDFKGEMSKVTKKGYRTLLSSCWYLDIISYGADWKNYYKCDPHDFEGSDEQKALVIGGESAVWGEFIDGSNVIPRSWPRSSAVAERLWSSQNVTDIEDASLRLESMRCRMIRRGINAEPLNGPGFCKFEVTL